MLRVGIDVFEAREVAVAVVAAAVAGMVCAIVGVG